MLGGMKLLVKPLLVVLIKRTVENSTIAERLLSRLMTSFDTDTTSNNYYDGSDKWVIDFAPVRKFDDRSQVRIAASLHKSFLWLHPMFEARRS
jgi:hypothetical protein